MVGVGILFINYGLPSDEDIIGRMSPEVRGRYEREKRIREKASEITQRMIKEQIDKPAWLQGSGAMRKLDMQIAEEARRAIEAEDSQQVLESEKQRLRELASKETSMK